jgi:hypothetical protein
VFFFRLGEEGRVNEVEIDVVDAKLLQGGFQRRGNVGNVGDDYKIVLE